MPFLNDTSQVSAHQSVAAISQILSQAGARQIMHDDDDGTLVALSGARIMGGTGRRKHEH